MSYGPLAVSPPPPRNICGPVAAGLFRTPWHGWLGRGLSKAISHVPPDFLASSPRSQCNHCHQAL